MKFPELACRAKQETFKWMERIQAGTKISTISRRLSARRPAERDLEALSRFLRNSEDRFFQGPFDPLLPAALAFQAADHCKDLVATANEICRGRFDLLGYRNLDFGDPPDWHFDPISERRAAVHHWTRLDPTDYATVGDTKVVCELNRHQWLVCLGQAYRLTREERYAENLIRHMRAWLHDNPPGIGINWTSSLELALRVIAWCWALLLIRDCSALTPSVFVEIKESVRAQVTHIERYLSYYFSPNTHLTGEALGLLYAGVLFPDLKHAERWRSLGAGILIKEIERQVLADGVYFERSTCYQRYTIDTYLHLQILSSRAGFDLPKVVTERVRSMLDFLVTVSNPNGSIPSIGDADGGQLLSLSRSSSEDFRTSFSTAAVLFREPTYAWAAGELAPDTLWLLGVSAMETFEALHGSPPPDSESCRLFPDGGFAVMRSGWDAASHSLVFDTGPLGCPVTSGHGHADLLSIQCSVFGQPYLVDPGTGCYGAGEVRDFFRGTSAHSSVMVDGEDQAEPAGPFAWQSRPAGQLLRWTFNGDIAFADAEHDGYRTLPDPVSHRRRVIFVRSRYWVLVDDLAGAKQHRIEMRFQFAPMPVQIDTKGWVRATRDGRRGLLMRAFAVAPLAAEVREGRRNPLEGWVSPNYGLAEPAPVLVYSSTIPLPIRVVTVLWPSARVHEEMPFVEVIRDPQYGISGLAFPQLAETVLFAAQDPVIKRDVPQYEEALAT